MCIVCVCKWSIAEASCSLLKCNPLNLIYSDKMQVRGAFPQPCRREWCQQDIKILLLSILRLSDIRHLLSIKKNGNVLGKWHKT